MARKNWTNEQISDLILNNSDLEDSGSDSTLEPDETSDFSLFSIISLFPHDVGVTDVLDENILFRIESNIHLIHTII